MIRGLLLALAALLPAACAETPRPGPPGCKVAPVATLPILPGNFLAVQGALNRRPAVLMLDTGAEGSAVADWAVGELRLERLRRVPARVAGIGGVAVADTASARIGLGGDESWRELSVIPLPTAAGHPVAGLLGMGVLARYDMEVSFPERRVRLWETRDCTGHYALWGGAYWSAPLDLTESGRPLLAVAVDGHEFPAMLDTGSSHTALSRPAALALGVTEAELAADPATTTVGVDGTPVTQRVHRFRSVAIGPEAAEGVPVGVLPLRGAGAEMLLGVDWMRDHRLWISFRNRRLFVQPAAAIAPPAPGTPAAAFP